MLNLTGLLSLAPAGPFEGTLFGMIRDMDLFAQIVVIILLFLSVVSWAITFHKIAVFRTVNSETDKLLSLFRKRRSLSEVYLSCVRFRRTPLSRMFEAGFKELDELRLGENNPQGSKEVSMVEDLELDTRKDRYDVIRMTL